MCIFLILGFLNQASTINPTTLVKPPFGHTLGYYRATPYELRMILGKSISFHEPQGIACCKLKATDDPNTIEDDDELTLYCTNSQANQIVYNKSLRELKVYGKLGSGIGEFWWPKGITATENGDIYVADVENHRVVRLKNEIDSIRWVSVIGGFGCDTGEFDTPWDVAVDIEGKIWVADRGNNRVQVFDSTGKFIKQIKELHNPIALAITNKEEYWSYFKDNFLIVIDEDGKRIQKLDPDKDKVLARAEFPDYELSDCAIDYYSNIWVTDKKQGYIHKFDRFLKHITKVEKPDGGRFISPRAIAIWKRFGQVFIVEQEAINYLWVGVDGYIQGAYPAVFNPKEKGSTIAIYLTEPAYMSAKIYKNGDEVRDFLPALMEEPFEHNIVWDGRNNNNEIVGPGEYKIKIILEPTYSSRGYFKKEIETTVICE